MKKTIIILVALAVVNFAYSQEQQDIVKRNEVKLNLPVSIFGAFPEVSYERLLQEDFSIGASLGFSLDDGDTYAFKTQFTPYGRCFFGGNRESARKYAAGLFIEANASVFLRESDVLDYSNNLDYSGGSCGTGITQGGCVIQEREDTETMGAGLGLGLGWKFATRNNWVGEILLGLGKDFSNGGEAYPRFGISIGKRL